MRGFCEIISVDRKDLFFAFTPVGVHEGAHYSVTVALSGSSSVSFEMGKSACGSWYLEQNAPGWILGMQAELAQAINSNL
ncbi:MAG TPA: hypothetical protein VGB56_02030 [Flavisolibacter sp.]|jgi:hypothetical protein